MQPVFRLALIAGLTAAAALRATPAAADAISRTDPAQLEQRLEDRLDRERRPKPEPALPRAEAGKAERDTTPLFVLRAVRIEGAPAPPRERLEDAFGEFVGRKVSLSDLAQIARRITAYYRKQGQVLTRALILPQEVSDGTIAVRVIPGWIETVRIAGEAKDRVDLSGHVARLTAERPLSMATFERQLLLINDIFGLRIVDTTLEETGEASGRFRLVVVTTFDTLDAFASFDNRGSDDLGPLQTFGQAGWNSATGAGDRIALIAALTPATPREYRFVRLTYDRPAGDGFWFGGSVSVADLEPGGVERLTHTESRSVSVNLYGRINLVRRRERTLRATVTLSWRNFDEDNDLGIAEEDRLRTVTAKAQYDFANPLGGRTDLSAGVRAGLDVLGASRAGDPFLTRSDGDGEFVKVFFDASHRHPLGHDVEAAMTVSGQEAFRPLLSSEEFYLGGSRIGRAYDGGELSGDDGIAASLELRYRLGIGRASIDALQLYGFYDIGWVWDAGDVRRSLSSAGGGIRLTLADGLFASAELAVPLSFRSPENSDRDLRGFFYVSKRF